MNDHERGIFTRMRRAMPAVSLTFLAVTVFFFYGVSAGASGREDCIARHQKNAKCQAATYIINDTCKCKFDNNCRYPNRKAIDCILDNIGEVKDNSAAYLMRNSCIQKSLLSGQ
jgi:hypothetical protein